MLKELNALSTEFRRILEYNNIRGYALSLEFNVLNKTIKTNAHFSSSDVNSSALAVQLLNYDNPIILEESSIVYANVERADGTIITNQCTILDYESGAIIVWLNQLATEVIGTCKLEIVVRHSGNIKIVSPKISYKVFQSIDAFIEEPLEEEIRIIDLMIDEVVELKKSVVATNTSISEEEAKRIQAESKREASIKTLEARVDNKINEASTHISNLEKKIDDKITQYSIATLITNSEIDEIISNALNGTITNPLKINESISKKD